MNTTTPHHQLSGPWQLRIYNQTHANVLDEHGQGVVLNIRREHAERIVRAVALLAATETGQDAVTSLEW